MASSAAEQRSGTVTFLLTDVARSTAMWEADPESARSAIGRHDQIIEEAVSGCGGSLLKARGEGDSHFAVFDQAQSAVSRAHDYGPLGHPGQVLLPNATAALNRYLRRLGADRTARADATSCYLRSYV